jgi:hypothetical protein
MNKRTNGRKRYLIKLDRNQSIFELMRNDILKTHLNAHNAKELSPYKYRVRGKHKAQAICAALRIVGVEARCKGVTY